MCPGSRRNAQIGKGSIHSAAMKSLLVYVHVRAAQGNWFCSEERKRLKRGDLFENKHPRQGSAFSS